ncbi:MAG TPA: hypothetical protein VIE36_19590 [Methylomirabilota bacterium]|jgi:hypothetical protein
MRLAWRLHGPADPRALNAGVIVAVVLATLTAGFMGGLIVWALWRWNLLRIRDRQP